MFSFQWEVGIAGMIKTGVGPRCGIVAILALFAAASVVFVVLCVAAEAVIRCTFE